jgi:transposase
MLTKETFSTFIQQLNQALDRDTLLIADRASFHQSACMENTQLTLAYLPTACRELNPVERLFKEIRRGVAKRIFPCLQAAFTTIENSVKQWQENTQQLIQLTLFPYIQNTQLSS